MHNNLKHDRNYRTLPEICMELHMHHTGSSDVLSDEHYLDGVEYLSARVREWKPIANGLHNYCFDTQVLSLCLVTLDEAERYMAKFVKVQAR